MSGASPEPVELSDVIVDFDATSGARVPVRARDAIARLEASGQHGAARYVARLPVTDGVLDAGACDAILLRAHTELQRLNEEFLQDERIRRLLVPLLDALREHGVPPPYRVVDVGCGLGFVVRALAAHGRLGDDVVLMGCDMNRALVEQAAALARQEHLRCEFRVANAFTLAEPAHVFLSTGVLHHLRGPGLAAFFEGQRHAWGMVHHDIQRSALAPIGSWIFHRARMREPLAQHDGVLSAARVHDTQALLDAARRGSGLVCGSFDGARSPLSVILRPMHAVLGVRASLADGVRRRLGVLAARWRVEP